MMRFLITLFVILSAAMVLTGCDIETEPMQQLSYGPANHLVINEVYTLPVSNPNAHSWIEILNPTNTRVNIRFWSLNFTTHAQVTTQLTYYKRVGVSILPDTSFFIFSGDTVGRFDFYFTITSTETSPLRLGPNEFYTLISDKRRMEVYNNLGLGDGPSPTSSPTLVANPRIVIIPRDTTNPQLDIPDTLTFYSGDFLLRQTDQIILKDSTGRAVDVVRYGGYTYSGPGNDPYPSNQSIGGVPDYESIARYAGAYATGNSANDFYITHAGLRPIPHWFSQLYKK